MLVVKSSFYRNFFISLLLFTISIYPKEILAGICGSPVVEVGWFVATQGKSQHIGIEGLIGDDFSVTQSSDQNLLVGLGYFFNGLDRSRCNLLYGINAFYLAPTEVKGNIKQEGLFTNLSYHYSRTNYPIYFAAKSLVHFNQHCDLVLDLGIGPNIACTRDFKEKSLDGGITIPDKSIFLGKTSVAFSAMAGIGWRVNFRRGLFLEINYRFFYLGEGRFKKNNSQLKNTLQTGNSYANALFFSISI